jgi:hypothetical protein
MWSMLPLAVGICIDFYLIARIILDGFIAAILTAALFIVFIFFGSRCRAPNSSSG